MPSLPDLFSMAQVKGVYPMSKIALNDGSDHDPTVLFGVKQDEIDSGIGEDERCCALALAVGRVVGRNRYVVEVGARYVQLAPYGPLKGEPVAYWMLGPEAVEFVQRCYDCEPVQPLDVRAWPLDERQWLKVVDWVQRIKPRSDDDLWHQIPERRRPSRFVFDCFWNICEQQGLILFGSEDERYAPTEEGLKELQAEG